MKKKLFILVIAFIVFVMVLLCIKLILQFNYGVKISYDGIYENVENDDAIYNLFESFPKNNKIYSVRKFPYQIPIGPTIYEIDILAELTDESYKELVDKTELSDINVEDIDFFIKSQKKYNWKEVNKFKSGIEIKRNWHINNIYLDENYKTIYVKVIGGH